MRFLTRLSRIFSGSSDRRTDDQSTGADTPLARYIYSRSHFSKENHAIKPGAFLPPRDLELSVFRTDGLRSSEIWRLGRDLRPGRTLHARADFRAGHVDEVAAKGGVAAAIALVMDDDPPRHANIVGWPADKPEQKRVAMEFAVRSTLAMP